MQDTLALIKPDAVARDLAGEILAAVQAATGSAVLTAAPGSSTRNILPGLKVDLYPAAGGTAIATGLRVVDVNHLTGKITLSGTGVELANSENVKKAYLGG